MFAIGTSQAAALNGVILQMFNHGLTAAALFWFMAMLQFSERRASAGSTTLAGCAKPRRCLRANGDCAVFVARVAGTEWICWRVSDLPWSVSACRGWRRAFQCLACW